VKIALVTEIPAPYRIPLFNELAARDGVELRVYFLSRNDPRRNYPVYESEFRFDSEVLAGRDVRVRGRWVVLNAGTRRALRRFAPDVAVVGGWNQPAFWSALTLPQPVVVWVESTARDERRGRGPLELAKRAAVRRAAAFLVPGRAAREYVLSLGVPAARIAVAPNAVDESLFSRVDRERGSSRCRFVSVSRLSPEKGVDVLVQAMHGVDAELVVVGDGPDEMRVRDLAPDNVTFAGRVTREELPGYYAAADAFVMPSRSETWGIAMQEAATVGLPLVSTEAPGAAYDLIEEGINGFRVPSDDVTALRQALERVAADPEWRSRARLRTLELAEGLTAAAWAAAVEGLAGSLVRE
jgi:glycosyltransferase involved in cell wall biosynthesis